MAPGAVQLTGWSVLEVVRMPSRRSARFVLPVVLAVVDRVEDARTLTATLGHVAQVQLCSEGANILRLVEECRPSLLLVALPHHRCNAKLLSTIQQVHASWPAVWIVACAPLSPAAADAIAQISSCDVHELVLQDRGSLSATIARLSAMTPDDLRAAGILQALHNLIPDDLHHLAEYCLRHAREGLKVPRLAAELGMSRRTLAYRLRRAGLPPPEALISWCRLFMAAVRIIRDGETIEQVALSMGLSGAALHMMLRKRVECTWAELRARGSVAHLILQYASRYGREENGEGRRPASAEMGTSGEAADASQENDPPPRLPQAMP